MDKQYWRHITSTGVLVILIVLSFLLLRPILMSVLTGILLAFIFLPIYNALNKKLKSKDITAFLVSTLLVVLLVIPLWFLIPVFVNQSIQLFISSQNLDLVTPLQSMFPAIFASEVFSLQIGSAVQGFITGLTSSMMGSFAELITNFPIIFLKTLVVLLTFFFTIRDSDKFVEYIQSILPFPKEIEKKLFKSSRDITSSILYWQVLMGIVQGLLVGLGMFLFGVNNALLLTLAACVAGVIPIIGTSIVWVPLSIYLFVTNSPFTALGIIFFGILSLFMENAIKPFFVSKKTKVHSSVILLGMVGGLLFFGTIGFIIGPLILAYLLIILELYRDKKVPGILITENKK